MKVHIKKKTVKHLKNTKMFTLIPDGISVCLNNGQEISIISIAFTRKYQLRNPQQLTRAQI